VHKPPKVLIVDDEPLNIGYLEQELDDLGLVTVSAGDGEAALAQVAAEAPDLVLLDMMMPVMDGFAVLAHLKAEKATRAIPVIVISALTDIRSIARGIELGADDYLPKPFEPVVLKARIASSLEKKRLRDHEQLYLRGLERELEIGRQIQAGFLPTTLPQPVGWEIAGRLQPARQVAGDFYDAFALTSQRRIGLVIGDVCNKGVGAALFMAIFRSLVRAGAGMQDFAQKDPSLVRRVDSDDFAADSRQVVMDTVALTNNYVAQIHGASHMFASLFFGVLDPLTGSLVYINGGHEPIFIVGPNGVEAEITPTGPVVGLFTGAPFRITERRIEPGQSLLALTDGVADARSPSGAAFSNERLHDLLGRPASSAATLLDRLETALAAHIAGGSQFDDITMLAVRRMADPPPGGTV
jgi:serine phosphatase RsbU (regulator of sigma subunit)